MNKMNSKGQANQRQALLAGYEEPGIEKGAKLQKVPADNKDLQTFLEAALEEEDPGLLAKWIEKHQEVFSSRTAIRSSADGPLLSYSEQPLQLLLITCTLSCIPHLNSRLAEANKCMEQGGYLWCHTRTSIWKRRYIMSRYPIGLNYLIFLLHFIWHRVMPKLFLTRPLYFAVTRGRNRTYHRVEVMGRLYRAGFEVVDERFRLGEFCILARKVKAPMENDTPSGSPIIKMRRIGKSGKIVGVYKFRTMYSYSEYLQPYIYEHNHLAQGGKFADDYRITPWGRWMRKLWIDELPMIWNILRGDLKLVGVRPLSAQYLSLYTPEMQQLHTSVKPGLLPPFYAESQRPQSVEEVQISERRYIESYLKHPLRTDLRYMKLILCNILWRGARSA